MPLDSPLFALGAFALALATAWLLAGRSAVGIDHVDRFASIDGLRGFLAFGVFLHHAVIWKVFLATGAWVTPTAHLYAHLGDSAVVLFFMVTAFLFTGKVIDSRDRPIRWTALYAGRFFRLMPLYALTVALVCVIVLLATGPHLQVSVLRLADELLRWAGLAVFGMPDINGHPMTAMIVASVPWTLRYEVLFYAALPLLAALAGRPWSVVAAACGLTAIGVILGQAYRNGDSLIAALYVAFLLGIFAAYTTRWARLAAFARSRAADVLIVAIAVSGVVLNSSGLRIRSVVVFGMAFILIAAGSDLFGLLRTRAARFLGDISYSIYLLHGIVLYLTIVSVLGAPRATELTEHEYWSLIYVLTPCIVAIAASAYRLVEQPCIAFGRRRSRDSGTSAFNIPAIP